MMSDEDKKKLCHRLSRIVGQVEAVSRMIDADDYCIDTLMQISAATGALHRVAEIILEQHLSSCVRDALESGNDEERQKKLDEIMTIFRKYGK